MPDLELTEEVYRRFHSASEEVFDDRIAHLSIDDLPFTNSDGRPFGKIRHLARGDDKSGAAGAGVAHGFITDPDFGATVFLSIQSSPIRKIVTDPNTGSEKFDDDFVYVDDAFFRCLAIFSPKDGRSWRRVAGTLWRP